MKLWEEDRPKIKLVVDITLVIRKIVWRRLRSLLEWGFIFSWIFYRILLLCHRSMPYFKRYVHVMSLTLQKKIWHFFVYKFSIL